MPYNYPFYDADEKLKRLVWEKGEKIVGFMPFEWRRDICGNIMKYVDHGNINSEYGWEIDHKKPTALGGTDDISNLQPLYWKNNRDKGDTYPWSC